MDAHGAALGFRRSLVESGVRIESVCEYCGVRIIGSASEHLIQDEANHREKCRPAEQAKKPQRATEPEDCIQLAAGSS
jgi:hypothetical protein